MEQEAENQERPEALGGSGTGEAAGRARSTDDGSTTSGGTAERGQALFDPAERDALWQRWTEVQTEFVDQPQRSVERANALVSDLTERLVASFRGEQARLEAQWAEGGEVSTEDLRMVLQRYRSFFSRLLELQGQEGS